MKGITLIDNDFFTLRIVALNKDVAKYLREGMGEREITELFKKYGEFLEIRLIEKE